MTKNRWILFCVAIIVLFAGLILINKVNQASLPQSEGSSNVYGKQDSKVTLTEFVDFQCEACYGYYPTVKAVKEKYKDTVKFQIRHLPISTSHKSARMAAAYAEGAAKQGKFFEMHNKIFEGQKLWETASNPATYFDEYADEIGLDKEKLKVDRESSEVTAIINADVAAAKKAGASGTPTFLLNGKKIESVENSVEALSKILDDALAADGGTGEKK